MRNLIKYEKIFFYWKNIINWLVILLSWVCLYYVFRLIMGYKLKERWEIKYLSRIVLVFDCYSLGYKFINIW